MTEPLTAAAANRHFYERFATTYDESEWCAADPEERRWLRRRLEFALAQVHDPRRLLDAGGGTGNAASILVELGHHPVVVDVSEAMLARWQAKQAAEGREANVVRAELEEFFEREHAPWDLIVFSSVLHHLEDPAAVLGSAAERLAPGGALLTVHDPLPAGTFMRGVRRTDWIAYALIHHRWAVHDAIRRRLRTRKSSASHPENLGRLAERHALRGLDPDLLLEVLRSRGLEIVEIDLLPAAQYRPLELMLRVLRRPSAFSLVARRPS